MLNETHRPLYTVVVTSEHDLLLFWLRCWHPLSAQLLFHLRQRVGSEKLVALETANAKLPHNSAAIYKPWIKSWREREREREVAMYVFYSWIIKVITWRKPTVQNTSCAQSCMHRPLALRKTLSTSCACGVLHCTHVLMLYAFLDPFSFMSIFIMCQLAVLWVQFQQAPTLGQSLHDYFHNRLMQTLLNVQCFK